MLEYGWYIPCSLPCCSLHYSTVCSLSTGPFSIEPLAIELNFKRDINHTIQDIDVINME